MKLKNPTWTLAAVALLAGLTLLAGCSCKEYEQQISQLDAQIAQLQKDLAGKDTELTEREQVAAELSRNLADCQSASKVQVEQRDEVVMITVEDQLTFKSGQFVIQDGMVPVLKAIGKTIGDHPDWDCFVEGYTDNKKIGAEHLEKYPSNWELGAYRSCAVVRYLTNELGLPAGRFAAVSYGPFHPVATNDTEEGRAQNRMVRFILHKPRG